MFSTTVGGRIVATLIALIMLVDCSSGTSGENPIPSGSAVLTTKSITPIRTSNTTTTAIPVTYTATATIPASAFTTRGTGITNWAFFEGNKNGYPAHVLVGTDENGTPVWEIDFVDVFKYGVATVNTSQKTAVTVHSTGNPIVTSSSGSTVNDEVYAAAAYYDMVNWTQGGGTGRPTPTGPRQDIAGRGTLRPAVGGSTNAMDANAFWHGWFIRCAAIVSTFGGIAGSLWSAEQDAEAEAQTISWYQATNRCSLGVADLIMDPLNMSEAVPVASFTDTITVTVQGDPPAGTVNVDAGQIDWVNIPPPLPPTGTPASVGPGNNQTQLGDGTCELNIVTESLNCTVQFA